MGRVERSREIARRRARKSKLRKLRARYAASTDPSEKRAIIDKVRRVSAFVDLEQEEAAAK